MEPFDIDLSSVGAALDTFFKIVGAILRRERGVIAAVHDQPGVLYVSVAIVLVAGLSERIGQSVVLFVNEIGPRRFVISLFIGSVLFLGGYVLWIASIWVIATLLFRPDVSPLAIIRAVGLGYTPLIFGFLGLIPYFGTGILTILYFWVFVAIVFAVGTVLDLAVYQAVIVSAAGGLVILVMRATIGKPFVKWARRLRNLAAGKRLVLRVQDAVDSRTFDTLVERVMGDGEERKS